MRILLVEDDRMLGKATADGLKTAYAVDWCESAEDATEALRTTDYDLAIFDVNLPAKSGLDLLKEMRDAKDDRPVLFLTARDALHHKIDGLNAGADDYLTKPFELDELLARAGALIRRRKRQMAPQELRGGIVFDKAAHIATKNGEAIALSARELAVLEVLADNVGRVISKTLIEQHVYDWSNDEIESNTIEVHISALRRKLGKTFIKTVRGLGYMIPS